MADGRQDGHGPSERAWTWILRSLLLPAGDRVFGQRMIERLRFLETAQWWDRERVEVERQKALAALVATAYGEVPFYRDLFDAARVGPRDASTREGLRRVPIVTKQMLRARYPNDTTRPTGQRTYESCSSGSTGTQFCVREDMQTAGWYRASFLLALEWSGWTIGDAHVQTGMTIQRTVDRRWKDLLLRCDYMSATDLSDASLDACLDRMERHHLQHVFGYPGSLYYLATRAAALGWNRPLRSAVTWGDMLHPHYRREIEAAFGTRVFDTYGCGEGIQIAAQCGTGDTYHVHSLDTIVEYVDDSGSPVAPGQPGNVLLTRLHPGPMPLIRYAVGDIGSGGSGRPCACGRGFEVLTAIEGRSGDVIVTPSGNRLIVHFFTGILEHFRDIANFQVVQEEPDRLVVRVVPSASFSPSTADSIRDRLRAHGLTDMRIEVVATPEIPMPKSNKHRFVRSLVRPETPLKRDGPRAAGSVETQDSRARPQPAPGLRHPEAAQPPKIDAPRARPSTLPLPVLKDLYRRLPTPFQSLAASLHGYQLQARRYGPETEKLVEEALERDYWDTGRWTTWQEDRLSRVLHQAAKSVPFYRDYWAKRRRSGDRASREVLANWPILTKQTLREHPQAFVADNSRRLFESETSGTTGTPLRLWQSRETLVAWYALFEARIRRWNQISLRDRWAHLGGQHITPARRREPPFWVWNQGMRQLYMSTYHITADAAASYLDAMRRYGVVYVFGYSTALSAIAAAARENGLDGPPLRVAVSNAEPLYAYQRLPISEVFHCPVRDTYGQAEIVSGGSECPSGIMHLWPEVGWTEWLHEDANEPAPPGEVGRMICTAFLNPDMPLIRYEVGDRSDAPNPGSLCDCGRRLPIIRALDGRLGDVIVSPRGAPIGPLDIIFHSGLPIREGQIIQEALTRIRVRVVPTLGFGALHQDDIVQRVRERLGDTVDVVVEPVDAIARTPAGKFQTLISRLPDPFRRNAE